MTDLNRIIAANLRRIREDRKLSLDRVAELTGVSKSMLGQVERGESNPTITTLWKIAGGLRVSFTALVNCPQADTVVVGREEVEPLCGDGGRYRVYPIFPYEEGRRFELYTVEIEPGGRFASGPHGDNTEEFITVFDGELTLGVNGREYRVARGDSIRVRADRPHSYANAAGTTARLSLAIHYQ
jgi:transcriptional regulator with XRE-family HTH domain